MKIKWSGVFMIIGIYIGVIMPPVIMINSMTWYTPLIAVVVGFLGLAMFVIPFSRPDSFDESQELNNMRTD